MNCWTNLVNISLHQVFKDRKDAGKQLAKSLHAYQYDSPLILAIPRGGVEVAFYVAKELASDFTVLITRKLGYPRQPELAFGAIAEDKSLYLNPAIRQKLTREIIEAAIKKEQKEIKRRITRYRKGKPLPNIKGRTVIIVDDGIATGSTLFAAIELCKKQGAAEIIIAAPVASTTMEKKLHSQVDDVIILETPVDYHAVSQAYQTFSNLSDSEVISLLDRADSFSKNTIN